MYTSYTIAAVVMPILAAIALLLVAAKLRKLIKLQSKFKQSIVLVPLYRRKFSLIFGFVMLLCCDVFCAYYFIQENYAILFICLVIVSTSFMVLTIFMFQFKFAIMDKGILVPYRFIEWHHLYDYYIEGFTVSFGGNAKGQDTLTANTPPLKFNVADLEKLKYVLAKNQVKHKSNFR